ncbi:MAG: hypothetical protein J2P21_18035 [Chloracidobacterium sp.]|nr:hypothetical protein [Chloracidobacterium sp.]
METIDETAIKNYAPLQTQGIEEHESFDAVNGRFPAPVLGFITTSGSTRNTVSPPSNSSFR